MILAPLDASILQRAVALVFVLAFAFHLCSALWLPTFGKSVLIIDRIGTFIHGISFLFAAAGVLDFPRDLAVVFTSVGVIWLFLARRLYELALPSSRR